MTIDFLYTVDKECVICKQTFPVTKVRSKLQMVKQDGDFCTHYKEMNPNYYTVWVCPHCGYAAQDTYFSEVPPAAADKIRKFLEGRQVNINLSGTRSYEQAIAAFKLAIFLGELVALPASRLGGLYLKMAWMYREKGLEEEERMLMTKAREYYEKAPLREKFPIGNMTEVTLDYLIGELYRRTGQLDQALSYLSKVVSSPQAKLEKRIQEMAKEAWQAAREEKRKKAQAE